MDPSKIQKITDKILQLQPNVGEYNVLVSHLMMMDYSVRLSYNEFLDAVGANRKRDLDGVPGNAYLGALKVLANARFFFDSIYGFVYMFERLSKDRSEEPLILILKDLFGKYKILKMPRVKVAKDNFNKLIWAEATGNQGVIEELVGDSRLLYEFSTDPTGQIIFQGQPYDPHEYFRIYTRLLEDFEKQLDEVIGP